MLKNNLLEEINLETKEFVEKKAEEYVARLGEDAAIEKLSKLAAKSKQAQKMLEVITTGLKPVQPQPKFVRQSNGGHSSLRSTTLFKLEPKQHFLNLISKLGLSYDTPADDDWNPIADVVWQNGHAEINGNRVTFGKEHISFMSKNVLNKKNICFRMHLLNANDQGVVATPDINDYFRRINAMRKERERKARERSFEGSVYMGRRGIYIKSTVVHKRIVVPKRYMEDLLVQRGTWKFERLYENEKQVVARPIEQLEASTAISDTRMGMLMNKGKVSF